MPENPTCKRANTKLNSNCPPPLGYDLLRLENQLCFALYAATRAMTKTYRDYLEPMGLTYPQYLVLLVLWETNGVTVSQIGNRLRLDSGTLTPLLKRLEGMGLVTRERSLIDGREVAIMLSSQGLDLKDVAINARLSVACRLGMTEGQILELRSDLMEIGRAHV